MAFTSYSADADLIRDYINGDEKSLEILIYKHKSKIYNFIFSKVHDREAAEDVFQETYQFYKVFGLRHSIK